jgi:hypothetical protein
MNREEEKRRLFHFAYAEWTKWEAKNKTVCRIN